MKRSIQHQNPIYRGGVKTTTRALPSMESPIRRSCHRVQPPGLRRQLNCGPPSSHHTPSAGNGGANFIHLYPDCGGSASLPWVIFLLPSAKMNAPRLLPHRHVFPSHPRITPPGQLQHERKPPFGVSSFISVRRVCGSCLGQSFEAASKPPSHPSHDSPGMQVYASFGASSPLLSPPTAIEQCHPAKPTTKS